MRSKLKIKSGIELAAFVDIVFLLVTYFLINSTIARKPMIKVDLPKSVTAQAELEQNIIVYIDGKNQIYINDEITTMKELPAKLKSKAKKLDKDYVVIKGDKKASYQVVISVMDQIHKAGIKKFNLATEK